MKPYYQDDAVTLYHGDCREIVPTLGRFDLLLTDPPYGIGFAAQPLEYQRKNGMKPMMWDNEAPDILPFLASAPHQIVWGGNYFPLPPSRQWFVWHKPDSPPSMSRVELAWTNRDALSKIFHWCISQTNAERLGHPAQKPLALISWCLSHYPDANTILDPFTGSGTTLRAAKDLGRKAIGIEIEEKYCEIAAKRMQQEVLQLTTTKAPLLVVKG